MVVAAARRACSPVPCRALIHRASGTHGHVRRRGVFFTRLAPLSAERQKSSKCECCSDSMARGVQCLRSYVAAVYARRSPEATELQTQEELVRVTVWRQLHEVHRESSLVRIPRFHCISCKASSSSMCAGNEVQLLHHAIQHEIILSARSLQRKRMVSLLLRAAEIEQLWFLLCEHASLPLVQIDARINYDDFSRVAEAMSEIAGPALFRASCFLKFPLDGCELPPTPHTHKLAPCERFRLV